MKTCPVLTFRPGEARVFTNRADAWDAANAYVAANPTHSADVDRNPTRVIVWRPGVGWKGWLK